MCISVLPSAFFAASSSGSHSQRSLTFSRQPAMAAVCATVSRKRFFLFTSAPQWSKTSSTSAEPTEARCSAVLRASLNSQSSSSAGQVVTSSCTRAALPKLISHLSSCLSPGFTTVVPMPGAISSMFTPAFLAATSRMVAMSMLSWEEGLLLAKSRALQPSSSSKNSTSKSSQSFTSSLTAALLPRRVASRSGVSLFSLRSLSSVSSKLRMALRLSQLL
mmetsp:Transcript_18328/g.70800  ORF Transcript_18328/g.70800 Transcript_18328/m.70800 type:complete len:219 (+) Transcript_18328:4374-5030(+)